MIPLRRHPPSLTSAAPGPPLSGGLRDGLLFRRRSGALRPAPASDSRVGSCRSWSRSKRRRYGSRLGALALSWISLHTATRQAP